MNKELSQMSEVEKDRQERLAELVNDGEDKLSEEYKPGTFGCHELLDRTAMVAATVEEYVLNHPACVQNPDWFALAEQAVSALNELYQRIGTDHLTK